MITLIFVISLVIGAVIGVFGCSKCIATLKMKPKEKNDILMSIVWIVVMIAGAVICWFVLLGTMFEGYVAGLILGLAVSSTTLFKGNE